MAKGILSKTKTEGAKAKKARTEGRDDGVGLGQDSGVQGTQGWAGVTGKKIGSLWKHHRGRPLGLRGWLDQVATEGDVRVKLVAEDGVLTLALEEAHPHLVLLTQVQHEALALHDAPVAHLCI